MQTLAETPPSLILLQHSISISNDKIIYEIEKVPEDLQNKYTEATSNIKLISGSNNGNIIL